MKAIKPGVEYELENHTEKLKYPQRIYFVHYDDTMSMGWDGTTTEEVLLMLIDRHETLAKKFPNRESSLLITKLQEAFFWQTEFIRKHNS